MDKKFLIGTSIAILSMMGAVGAAWTDSREDIVQLKTEIEAVKRIEESHYQDLNGKIGNVTINVKEVQRQLEMSEERQSKQLDRIERYLKN